MKRVYRKIDIDTISIEWCHGMNKKNKLEAAWINNLSEKDYLKGNLGNVPHTFEDSIALLRNISGPSGIFLVYCVIDTLVTFAYEDDTKKYPTKDEEMINHAPIFTSAATGTHMEKTKDGTFYKDFIVDMIVLWDILHHIFGGTTVWVHVKLSTKVDNSQYALFLLKKLFLCPQYVTKMSA